MSVVFVMLVIYLILADLGICFVCCSIFLSRDTLVESLFGFPIVARLPNISCGYDIHREFLKLIHPFLMPSEDFLDECDNEIEVSKDNELSDATSSACLEGDSDSDLEADFKFYSTTTLGLENVDIKMDEPLPFTLLPKKLEVSVLWSDKMIEKYDTCLLSSLPEVYKPEILAKRTQESVSVYKCLEAFLKEEPLGPDDMWLVLTNRFCHSIYEYIFLTVISIVSEGSCLFLLSFICCFVIYLT